MYVCIYFIGCFRSVLKPKELYSHRPLPHMIGSIAWRRAWHAGLLPADSDEDSAPSLHEEYSDSEPEPEHLAVLQVRDRNSEIEISFV
jgi:hypothetical protein